MPTANPEILLKADLQSINCTATGLQTPLPGYLRVTLCGYGPVMPVLFGVGVLADAGIPQIIGPQTGSTPLEISLWGNDAITPGTTFYEVAVLDENKNVIQAGMYQFTGSGTIDLSEAPQIVPPYGFMLSALHYVPCAGAIPGTIYTAPGSPVIFVTYNGILLVPNLTTPSPPLGYNAVGNQITLNFTTQAGDRIYAACVS